jgi:endonuclease III
MKSGTAYAARLKKAYTKYRGTLSAPEIPELADPLRCLAAAVIGVGVTEDAAERGIDRLLSTMVDWNEVRVSNASEVYEALGRTYPDGAARCQLLIDALQSIYDRENGLSLDHLANMGRREARQYLEKLAGVDEYAVASVLLWGLGGHAIPVNDRLFEALRQADLVHPAATRAEVQAFLERHVGASEAKEFCLNMRGFKPAKREPKRRTKSTRSGKTKRAAS